MCHGVARSNFMSKHQALLVYKWQGVTAAPEIEIRDHFLSSVTRFCDLNVSVKINASPLLKSNCCLLEIQAAVQFNEIHILKPEEGNDTFVYLLLFYQFTTNFKFQGAKL
jgi:hypothetical protein